MDQKILVRIIGGFVFLAVIGSSFVGGVYYERGQKLIPPPVADLINLENGKPPAVDFSVFWKTWKILDERYVNDNGTTTESITNQKKVWGATAGLVDSLGDPYTVFLPPAEKKIFEEDIRGNFGGVGLELGVKAGVITVIAPLPETPASRAGILAGDQITQIDGQSTINLAVDQAVKLIRGEAGTTVKLLLNRAGRKEPFETKLTRAVIKVPALKTEILKESNVFVIKLHNFSEPAPNAFRAALREFIVSGTDKLIIDLRGNPGGYLEAAVDIASWFLPEGRVVVREYHGGKTPDKIYRSRGYDIFNDQLKLVILIDNGSASAAEILAGALAEYDKGVLVGEKTFGKGSVQELVAVDDSTSVKVTIAKWLTPQGRSISGNGLDAQVKVAITEDDKNKNYDPQLAKAVEILQAKP